MTGYAWAEDKEHCEENGRMLQANPSKVSQRAKKRGLPQVCAINQQLWCYLSNDIVGSHAYYTDVCLVFEYVVVLVEQDGDYSSEFVQLGTLGAGNHYAEIQVVDEIFDKHAATKMGLDHKGQVR